MCAKICIAQFQNMKDCAFSLQNNKIIDILRKKFQENKKPIRQWCGLVKCGGGNRARSTAIATEGQSRAAERGSHGIAVMRFYQNRIITALKTKEKPC